MPDVLTQSFLNLGKTYSDQKEIFVLNDGDFTIGNDGDICTISESSIVTIAQDICILLERTFEHTDNDLLPKANLSIFHGEPITEETIEYIKMAIKQTILNTTDVTSIDITNIKVINNTLLVKINITISGDKKIIISLESTSNYTYATTMN